MSEKNRPLWTYPFGIKITDWASAAAFVLSLFGVFGVILAEQLDPTIEIALPGTIQIQCSNYDWDKEACPETANFETVVDLFTIWNKSLVSTKSEVLEEITGVAEFKSNRGVVYSLPLSWKYFTEITDVSTDKRNTGWVLLPKGKIENLETEFVVDSKNLDSDSMGKWKTSIDHFVGKENVDPITSIEFSFSIQFLHSDDRTMICKYNIDQKMKESLKKKGNYYHNFPRTPDCQMQ